MYLVDSHCHLDNLNYQLLHKSVDDVLEKAFSHDVKFFLTVATTLPGYRAARNLLDKRNNIVFSCGVHPMNQEEDYNIDDLHNLATEKNVVALGETGLDYHSLSENKVRQQVSFRNHIRIGREINKPVIVHMRNACIDTLKILKEEKVIDCGGVLHSFTENKEIASRLLDLGFYISFSGIITFPNVGYLHDVVRYVPLDRMLIETDSPYLTPVPHRGKENHPAMTRKVAECIAMIKKINIDKLANVTTRNFFNLFHIDSVLLQSSDIEESSMKT